MTKQQKTIDKALAVLSEQYQKAVKEFDEIEKRENHSLLELAESLGIMKGIMISESALYTLRISCINKGDEE